MREETVVDIESSVNNKPESFKTIIRNELKPVVKEMKKTKKSKVSVQNFRTIDELRKKDVIYLKADKGNSLVIMDKVDYENRMNELIKESDFIELKSNPMNRMKTNAKDISTIQ